MRLRSFKLPDVVVSRAGQVWTGVFNEDNGDVCLCLESELSTHKDHYRHRWLDLETGELRWARESEDWEGVIDRSRLA